MSKMKVFNGLRLYAVLLAACLPAMAQKYEYKLLSTTRTSTMEKEMNQAAEAGFVFGSVMGGETGMGGKEVVVVMVRNKDVPAAKKSYRLLATSRTGTM